MNKSYLAIAVASLLSYTSFSQAQSVSSDDMDTVVVLGKSENVNSISDIPANIVVIDQDEIKASGATSLSSLLRSRAGIQVSDTNSGPVFSLRGFTGEQAAHNTLILVDGRKLNKPDLSAPQLSSILISQIETVEILSGSAGVLYGDQAVGGVINIITKRSTKPHGEVTASVGSYDSYAGSVNVSNRIIDNWSFSLTASQNNSGNYRDHNDRETGSLLGRVDFVQDDKEFYTEASYYDNDLQYPSSLTKTQYEADPKQSTSTTDYTHEITSALRFGYKQNLSPDWLAKGDISLADTSSRGYKWGSFTKDNNEVEVLLNLERELSTPVGKGNVLFGVDYNRSDFDYLSSSYNRENIQQVSSLYTQVNYPLSNTITMITGGRYSKAEDEIKDASTYSTGASLSEDATAVELGANYKLSTNTRLYLRGETNFRFAKVDEQAYTSPDVVGLKPQRGTSIETGLDHIGNDYSVRLDAYNLKLKDEIVFDSTAEKPVGGLFNGANVNADESERYGLSVYVDKYLTSDLLVGTEYSYIDAEYTKGSNKDKELPWVAKHSGRGFTTYQFMNSWEVFAEAVYVGERYENSDSANVNDKLEAYWLGNLAISYSQQEFLATLRVDNMFDEKYAQNVTYSAWGSSYYPGNGREFKLTATYQF
ncbi:TonB-dependent receptor [Vibrio albus]|uniref:TonB-dependent receptor n=1 Tax=Vibrio albus TaxID=2200953 RepID=A0A2U3B4X5_9VIBR|nr:TonB-dependent receptor [Vibrio albus]PWI31839.1 TonB-dependent receptor [Vibrio albus]